MKRVIPLVLATIFATPGINAQSLQQSPSGKPAAESKGEAEILLSDSFDKEGGGTSALDFTEFANWKVKGQVDLIGGGDWGIKCAGSCVDLTGSSGEGYLITSNAFSFNAGDVMKLTVDVGGSQQTKALDPFLMTLFFDRETKFSAYSTDFGGTLFESKDGTAAGTSFTQSALVSGTAPISTWFFEFTAASAGTVQYVLGSTSEEAGGAIVDNVMISRYASSFGVEPMVSTVPEPTTFALMLGGLGALGMVARRRTQALADA
jgi:hypothetical protein